MKTLLTVALIGIAAFMLFTTFFGKQFGESLGTIGEGISRLLSPEIKPALVPTVGLEFTPGIWEWWQGAQQWLGSLGIEKDKTISEVTSPYTYIEEAIQGVQEKVLAAVGKIPEMPRTPTTNIYDIAEEFFKTRRSRR